MFTFQDEAVARICFHDKNQFHRCWNADRTRHAARGREGERGEGRGTEGGEKGEGRGVAVKKDGGC
jgi:hypothetical protein